MASQLHALFVGWGAEDYRLERAVDWSEGDLFTASLPDGHLLWVSRQIETETSTRFELSVSGPWEIVRSEWGWHISNPLGDPASSEDWAFDIQVGEERIIVTAADQQAEQVTPSTPPGPGPPTTAADASRDPDHHQREPHLDEGQTDNHDDQHHSRKRRHTDKDG